MARAKAAKRTRQAGAARGLGFPLLCDFDRPKVFSILLDLLGTSSTLAGSSAPVSALLQLIAIAVGSFPAAFKAVA